MEKCSQCSTSKKQVTKDYCRLPFILKLWISCIIYPFRRTSENIIKVNCYMEKKKNIY